MKPGRIKFYLDRWQNYGSKAQFFMVLYLFLRDSGMNPFLVIGGGIMLSILVMWVDARYIVAGELETFMEKNPAWKKLTKEAQ